MKKFLKAGILSLCIFFMSGCTANIIKNPTDLIKQPRLEVSKQKLKNAVLDILPTGAKLTSPTLYQNVSPINLKDLDNDGIEEAIAFYTISDSFTSGAIILKFEDETWKQLSLIEELGKDIDKVEFLDILGDDKFELVIGYTASMSSERNLMIYSYDNGNFSNIFNNYYSQFEITDMDKDGNTDIVVLKLNRNVSASAELYEVSNGEIVLKDTLEMDSSINGYQSVISGLASKGRTGIFIDYGLGTHSSATDLLIVEDDELVNVFYKNGKNDKTFKEYGNTSQDIDGDGIIDICLYEAPLGYEHVNMFNIDWIYSWYKWDGKDGLTITSKRYPANNFGYSLDFPKKWLDGITILSSNANNSTKGENSFNLNTKERWLSLNYKDLKSKNKFYEMYTIDIFPQNAWKKEREKLDNEGLNYTILAYTDSWVYILIDVFDEKNLPLDLKLNEEEIFKMFSTY